MLGFSVYSCGLWREENCHGNHLEATRVGKQYLSVINPDSAGVELRKNVNSSNRTSEMYISLVWMKFNLSDWKHKFGNINLLVSRLSTDLLSTLNPRYSPAKLLHWSNQTYHAVNIDPLISYNE